MDRRDTVQFRIDFRDKRSEMQLLGELPGVEITDRGGLDFGRISLRIIERFLSGFGDEMPDCFTFLF